MSQKKPAEIIQVTVEKMLEKLGLESKAEVKKSEDGYGVEVETRDPGILIGYHGETLNSFQHLLKLIVYKETEEWPSLVVETADYRKNREKVLRSMALSAIERVRLSGQPFALPPLSSYERKVVHMILAEKEEVISESEGEGRERRIVVRPKKEL